MDANNNAAGTVANTKSAARAANSNSPASNTNQTVSPKSTTGNAAVAATSPKTTNNNNIIALILIPSQNQTNADTTVSVIPKETGTNTAAMTGTDNVSSFVNKATGTLFKPFMKQQQDHLSQAQVSPPDISLSHPLVQQQQQQPHSQSPRSVSTQSLTQPQPQPQLRPQLSYCLNQYSLSLYQSRQQQHLKQPPIANLGLSQTVYASTLVTLDGSAS